MRVPTSVRLVLLVVLAAFSLLILLLVARPGKA